MISAAIALSLSQAAAPAPPAQDAAPVVRRQSFAVQTPGVSFPAALLPMMREYQRCTHPVGPVDLELGHEESLRARLAGCKAVRDRAIASAIAAYPKRPDRPGDLRAHVATIFDSVDKGALLNARFMDRMTAGQVPPPADGETIILSEENDDGGAR
ncbi:MAG TPA: hypothetical protein VGR19_05790 [Allosphingosinicella sp.]|nr:hypothetical protein [Allosphingosinicella sp.]